LIVPFPESSLNDEAGKLFMESYDEYSKRAHLMADVHGRPSSSVEGDEKRRKTESLDNDDGDKESTSPRRKSGSNPLGSKNANNISSSGKNGKSLGAKGASGRMSKKKSLKRL
jgi:ubiquitin-conjugating enzyme E2 S